MTNTRYLQKIIDSLCGELSAEEERSLQEAIQADPNLKMLSQKLHGLWDLLGRAFFEDESAPDSLERILSDILGADPDQIDEEDLDQAAGGKRHHPGEGPGQGQGQGRDREE